MRTHWTHAWPPQHVPSHPTLYSNAASHLVPGAPIRNYIRASLGIIKLCSVRPCQSRLSQGLFSPYLGIWLPAQCGSPHMPSRYSRTGLHLEGLLAALPAAVVLRVKPQLHHALPCLVPCVICLLHLQQQHSWHACPQSVLNSIPEA